MLILASPMYFLQSSLVARTEDKTLHTHKWSYALSITIGSNTFVPSARFTIQWLSSTRVPHHPSASCLCLTLSSDRPKHQLRFRCILPAYHSEAYHNKALLEACYNKVLATVTDSHPNVIERPSPWRLCDSNRLSNPFVYRSHWHTTPTRDTSRSRPCPRVHHSQLFSLWVIACCCYSSIIQTLRCRVIYLFI